jgi:DNA polymerase III subunit epsilon
MNFVSIDFETATPKRDSACAIGITLVRDGIITETFSHLICPPECNFFYYNTMIHGITAEHVVDSPTFGQLWPKISHFLENQIVVAHNASFDMSVLRHSLYTAEIPFPNISYLCTLRISKKTWPGLDQYKLDFLADFHNLQLDHHEAGSDSRAAAELLLLAANETDINCPLTLTESVDVPILTISPDDPWPPSSSAPRSQRKREKFEFTIPENYDITKHPFFEKNFVLTGELVLFVRKEAISIIEQLGGQCKNDVSKKVNYVVEGIQNRLSEGVKSNSQKKAKKLQDDGFEILIISEDEFKEIVTLQD